MMLHAEEIEGRSVREVVRNILARRRGRLRILKLLAETNSVQETRSAFSAG